MAGHDQQPVSPPSRVVIIAIWLPLVVHGYGVSAVSAVRVLMVRWATAGALVEHPPFRIRRRLAQPWQPEPANAGGQVILREPDRTADAVGAACSAEPTQAHVPQHFLG